MSRDKVIDLLGDDELVVLLEGPEFDAAIVGIVERYGYPRIVCYNYQKVIDLLQQQGMSEEEAVEWWDFNIIGAWMGDTTPCFLHPIASTPTPSTSAATATSSRFLQKTKPDAP